MWDSTGGVALSESEGGWHLCDSQRACRRFLSAEDEGDEKLINAVGVYKHWPDFHLPPWSALLAHDHRLTSLLCAPSPMAKHSLLSLCVQADSSFRLM